MDTLHEALPLGIRQHLSFAVALIHIPAFAGAARRAGGACA
jgi:hypothetical protein